MAEEGQGLFDPLGGKIPAAAARRDHDGDDAEGHEDEGRDAHHLAPPELTAGEVVLEGGDPEADTGRDGEGGRRQHHGFGRGE